MLKEPQITLTAETKKSKRPEKICFWCCSWQPKNNFQALDAPMLHREREPSAAEHVLGEGAFYALGCPGHDWPFGGGLVLSGGGGEWRSDPHQGSLDEGQHLQGAGEMRNPHTVMESACTHSHPPLDAWAQGKYQMKVIFWMQKKIARFSFL